MNRLTLKTLGLVAILSSRMLMADTWSTSATAGVPITTSTTSTKVGIGFSSTNSVKRTLDVNGSLRATYIDGVGFPVSAYGADPSLADNTTAFKNALNAAYNAGGGTVLVPPGKFKFNGANAFFTIPSGVTLQGSWQNPHDADVNRGTTLLVYAGKDNAAGTPFITLGGVSASSQAGGPDGSIRGVTIYYPDQDSPTSVIHAYPWTIRGYQDADIENVTLANSFQGIDLQGGAWNANSHFVKNTNMCVLRFGVFIDNSLDDGRLENIHIHPKYWVTAHNSFIANNWSMSDADANFNAIHEFTRQNLWGLRFHRCDGELVTGCFMIWAFNGMSFFPAAGFNPITNPYQAPWVHIQNSQVDISTTAVEIQASSAGHGIKMDNCSFVGMFTIGAQNVGPVSISNSTFMDHYLWSSSLLTKMGTGPLFISNGSFMRASTNSYPDIDAQSGAVALSNTSFSFISGLCGTGCTPAHTIIRIAQSASVSHCQSIWQSPLSASNIVNNSGSLTSCTSHSR